MTVLRLADVHFCYPGAAAAALAGLTLEVAAGDGVALLGANGAGKSTLLRLAMALAHPAQGVVEVHGRSTAGCAAEDLAPRVGFQFQDPGVQLVATRVDDEVAFGLRQLGWDEDRVRARVAVLLERLGLAGVAATHPWDLPLPQRRLVTLGCALAVEPGLVLLDEPTAGLDGPGRARVAGIVREECARGAAVVAITHDAVFAAEALARGVELAAGRVVRDAPLAALLDGPSPVLPVPVPLAVARGLGLPGAPVREAEVAAALADFVRG